MREAAPRVRSIPAGVPFLPTLVDALLEGRLVPDFVHDGDPLALADVTIYLPTRRAARALRGVFLERLGGRAAILPVIRPLGEFDDDGLFEADAASLSLAPPIAALDRLLMLAPLVQAWKQRLPAHLAQLYGEDIVVPASFADAIWLARDLADLIDEVETEGADWSRLAGLAPGDASAVRSRRPSSRRDGRRGWIVPSRRDAPARPR
jgi:ATP-dependent helicase/nuclease subunit B